MVTGLTFKIFDESGNEVELDTRWFKQKGTGLQVDWISDKANKKSKVTSNKLPDIKVAAVQTTYRHYQLVAI
jgi:hypothetical protein